MFKKFGLAIVLSVIVLLAGCTPEPAEKENLKIGSLPRSFDTIAYAAQQEGMFEEQGIEVEIVPFRSGIEMYTALTVGELDGIIDDLFMAVLLNKETDTVKIVGSHPIPNMIQIIAAPESNINSPADLKGKEIAVSVNTIMDYALDRLLMTHDISSEDVVKVNIPVMPLRLEALSQGQVPAAILTPPLSDMAVFNGGRMIIEDTEAFAGPGLIFSMEALENKPDAIERFIQTWQQSVDMINADPDKFHSLLVEVVRAPEAVSEAFEMPVFPKLRLPTQAEIDPVVSWLLGEEIITGPIPYDQVVDTRYFSE